MSFDPHILLRGASLSFGAVKVLENIDLSIAKGEVLTVLGPSGCGKTSLLRLIAGLIAPDHGEVLVHNKTPLVGHESAIVFQNFRLLPWKTLAENIAFVLPKGPGDRVAQVLKIVGLSRFADSYPRQLSGGMQQRVALARALAVNPSILLMDEPFASLDAQSRELMQSETLRLARDEKERTVIFVTHSVDEALILGDRVLLMAPRPGRVQSVIDIPFQGDADARRAHPDFAPLRQSLWAALREMVLSDPQSDFYGRKAATVE